jgi:exoribonuclease R
MCVESIVFVRSCGLGLFSHSAPRCADLNYRHRNAQMAGRASVELHTVIFFKKRLVSEKLNST